MSDFERKDNQSTFEKLLEQNGYIVYTNVGNSMMPFLRQRRDIIEIHKKGPDRCKKYDVVLYKRGERYILHRILEVLPDGKYVIAGDNNTFLEKDITDEHILGVMTRVIRDGKSIYMNNPSYKTYVHIWCDAYQIRMGILKTERKIKTELYKVVKLFGANAFDN